MNDVETVGGKNASLGEMISNLSDLGVTVPGGFATTAAAYRDFLKADGLDKRINGVLDDLDVDALGELEDRLLDLVGDVRDDLDRGAQIVAAPLLLDHRGVDLARREVVGLGRGHRGEPFVVSQVEVGLRTVVGDEDLAVLERAHRSRVDVDVRIEFLQRAREAAPFENARDRIVEWEKEEDKKASNPQMVSVG